MKLINHQGFKDIVCRFPSGVTIITTSFEGKSYGLTANSFSAVSLEPPLVSFCLSKDAGSFNAFTQSKKFAVSFLNESQEELARRFASRVLDKFEGVSYSLGALNCPIITNSIAHLECEVIYQYQGGDHIIFVGEVLTGELGADLAPALYYERKFHKIKDHG